MRLATVTLLILSLCPAARMQAQTVSQTFTQPPSYFRTTQLEQALAAVMASDADDKTSAPIPLPKYGGWVSTTKWITLATAAGLGGLGFKLHRDADKRFARLEARCNADPEVCRQRTPDGAYADAQLERIFQDVTSKDDQARLALIASQASFGASVILFIVDFGRSRGPRDIPYTPPDEEQSPLFLSLEPGEIALRYYLQ